ncbi:MULTISPECIES: ABC transporter ATP-binding protein [unclassified Virgibacillus]|uniref:ABC transporter ATP-binding protein n=1 Tax=unclassified Virgibacillus TaxID=2620237 RepID=UPI0024DE7882|nr:ABC transporter ATP-binding protein [Virgibacillus sp. LDC-1]
MIEFKQVNKVYADGTKAMDNFSLTIKKGEMMTLIGPSGCGKTTTMKMINRLIEPTSGSILINNQDIRQYNIHELRWNIGYVLQEIALFPHMTIEENISVVPDMKKWKRKAQQKRAMELLDMVGLEPEKYQKRMPSELSGGQQQRIGVIRALAADPDIILMDEPFSALDPISREQLQKDIRSLQKEIKKTIVFVTHDMDEALALGDRVCFMRNGKIIQVDQPQQLILHPETSFVESFIGERKSPWNTAIDVIMQQNKSSRIVQEHNLIEKNEESNQVFYVMNDDGRYVGAWRNGGWISVPVLSNELSLSAAMKHMKNNVLDVYPVVQHGRLIGTISYEDMIHFLYENSTATARGI